jgi:hypothetical protein
MLARKGGCQPGQSGNSKGWPSIRRRFTRSCRNTGSRRLCSGAGSLLGVVSRITDEFCSRFGYGGCAGYNTYE